MATSKRQYPHVDGITDWNARQSVRLLWDLQFRLQDAITSAQETITTQASTISSLQTRLSSTERKLAQFTIRPQVEQQTTVDDLNNHVIDGSFATGPTAINFPGLGIVQVYSSPDVSGWTETGTIDVFRFSPGLLTVNYSTMSAWLPGVNIGGAFQEATIWLFFQIAGVWSGAGAERLRPSQTTKVEATNYSQWPTDFWYDPSRWGTLAQLTPIAGTPAAALITAGSTRVDNKTLFTERTNIITFGWPADGATVDVV